MSICIFQFLIQKKLYIQHLSKSTIIRLRKKVFRTAPRGIKHVSLRDTLRLLRNKIIMSLWNFVFLLGDTKSFFSAKSRRERSCTKSVSIFSKLFLSPFKDSEIKLKEYWQVLEREVHFAMKELRNVLGDPLPVHFERF
jgi:hypothetical protein